MSVASHPITPVLGTHPTHSDNTDGINFENAQAYIEPVDLSDLVATPPKVTIENTNLFINNEWVKSISGKRFDTVNPATGEVITSVAEADVEDVNKAVKAARAAFEKVWKHVGPVARGNLLLKLATLLEKNISTMAAIESLDNGKTYGMAKAVDVTEAIATFRYFAGWASKIHGKTIEAEGNTEAKTLHEPFGVCGLIVPWNFPLLMATWKLAPALACGNCVVLKSSEKTPLSALYLASLIKEAGFPAGVVNILSGFGPSAGSALASHMDVDKLAFTGSERTGRRIMHASADSNLKKVTLELGGKSPAIIFPDVDLDEAVAGAVGAGLFFNAAQVCCAASRTFVHESIYDAFVAKTVEFTKKIQLSQNHNSFDALTPIVDDIQYKSVLGFMEKGKHCGAKLETGGNAVGGKGFYVQPTVFSNVTDNMDIAKQEIFGPVVSCLKFKTIEEVIQRANDTTYGLAASVWTNDLNVASVVVNNLKAGTVWVNCHNKLNRAVPFGGYKQSGIGRDLGEYALNEYTTVKAVVTTISKGIPPIPPKRA